MNKVEKKLDVLCLGAAVVDIPLRPVSRDIFDIESYPVEQIAMAVGGDAMNESTIISRLGFKTGLMAAVGDDAAGAFILRSCKKDNIDTEGVTVDPNLNTSINIGLVTADGERTFITNRNGSLWKENIEHVNFDKIKEAKILSLASIFNCPLLDGKTLEKIFKFAKEEGMTITADMIMPRLGETLDDIAGALQSVDYFFPNFDEACLMTGEKEEDKVYYTVKVYERGNTFTVDPSSNSAFFRAQSYDVAFEKDGGDCDISLEWETLSGSTESSQDDQLRIAHLVISQNGNILSDEKINFVGKAFGIVDNAIDKK